MPAKPDANQWINFAMNIYKEGKPPLLGTVDIKEIEDKAREAMKDDIRKSLVLFAINTNGLSFPISGIHVHLW